MYMNMYVWTDVPIDRHTEAQENIQPAYERLLAASLQFNMPIRHSGPTDE